MKARLEQIIRETAEEMGVEVLDLAVNPDHLHQFVSATERSNRRNRNPPQNDPAGVYVPNIGNPSTTMDVNGNGWLEAVFCATITFHTSPPGGSISYGSDSYTDGQTRCEGNLPPDYGNTVARYPGRI